MSDRSHEKISVLMDGEMEPNAIRFLIKRMVSDQQLAETWNHYHLIRGCLQKSPQEPLMVDVAEQVLARLGVREYHQQEAPSQQRRWIKPVAGAGIAASVALTALLMWQQPQVGPAESMQATPNFLVKQRIPSQSVPMQAPPVRFVDLPRAQLATSVSEWKTSGYPGQVPLPMRGFVVEKTPQPTPDRIEQHGPYIYLVTPEHRPAQAH